MYYHFKIHKERSGFWAECIELDGCFTQGKNLADLRKNMESALSAHLSEPVDSNFIVPEPTSDKMANLEAVKVRP